MTGIPPITVPINAQVDAAAVVRPGWRTTEFWLTASLHAMTLLMTSDLLPEGSIWAKVAALLMSAIAQLSYNTSRGDVKSAAMELVRPIVQQLNNRKLAWPLLAALLIFGAGGCSLLHSPAAAYVNADRSTFDAIAPEYARYAATDPTLSAEQIARRQRTVATWRLRIERAEKAGATSQPVQ